MTLLEKVQQLSLTEATSAIDYEEVARSYLELCGNVQSIEKGPNDTDQIKHYVNLKVPRGNYTIFVEYYYTTGKETLLDREAYKVSFRIHQNGSNSQLIDRMTTISFEPIPLSRFSSMLGSWLKKACSTLSAITEPAVLSDLVKSYMNSRNIFLKDGISSHIAIIRDVSIKKSKNKHQLTGTYVADDLEGQIILEETRGSKEIAITMTIDKAIESLYDVYYIYKPSVPLVKNKIIIVKSAMDLREKLYDIIGGLSKLMGKRERGTDIKLPTFQLSDTGSEVTGATAELFRIFARITPKRNLIVNFTKLFRDYFKTISNVKYISESNSYIVFPPRSLLLEAVKPNGALDVKKIRNGLRRLTVKYVKNVYMRVKP